MILRNPCLRQGSNPKPLTKRGFLPFLTVCWIWQPVEWVLVWLAEALSVCSFNMRLQQPSKWPGSLRSASIHSVRADGKQGCQIEFLYSGSPFSMKLPVAACDYFHCEFGEFKANILSLLLLITPINHRLFAVAIYVYDSITDGIKCGVCELLIEIARYLQMQS